MSTITVPEPIPSPEEDSQRLKKAFEGWGTDEKAIIDTLGQRTAVQRRRIAAAYQTLYNESLLHRLHDELSGDFRKAVILWATDPVERDAKLANEALKNKDDRHIWVIIEISCASSPDHLMAVRQAYCSLFTSSLEEDISSNFSEQQTLRKLLERLVSSYRYDGEHVDEELANSEAAKLYDALQKTQLHDEEVIRILGIRSRSQLKATFKHYKQHYGKAFDEDIEGSSIGDHKFISMLRTAVWCIDSPERHFAEVVRTSVMGLGTDEDLLTRAIVTRAEIDMKKIKEEYKIRYKTTLKADVIGDTSGYYKDFLLTLVGNED